MWFFWGKSGFAFWNDFGNFLGRFMLFLGGSCLDSMAFGGDSFMFGLTNRPFMWIISLLTLEFLRQESQQ